MENKCSWHRRYLFLVNLRKPTNMLITFNVVAIVYIKENDCIHFSCNTILTNKQVRKRQIVLLRRLFSMDLCLCCKDAAVQCVKCVWVWQHLACNTAESRLTYHRAVQIQCHMFWSYGMNFIYYYYWLIHILYM